MSLWLAGYPKTPRFDVRFGSMLSKKSFWGTAQIFLEALMRWTENDVGGHIMYRISDRQPS